LSRSGCAPVTRRRTMTAQLDIDPVDDEADRRENPLEKP
jgi:hypothetical protein